MLHLCVSEIALRCIQIDIIKIQLNVILLKAVLLVDEILASVEREHLSEYISSMKMMVNLQNDLQWKENKVDACMTVYTQYAHCKNKKTSTCSNL